MRKKIINKICFLLAALLMLAIVAQAETVNTAGGEESTFIDKITVQATCAAVSKQAITDVVTAFNTPKGAGSSFTPLAVEILSTGENCFQAKIVDCPWSTYNKKPCEIKGREYTFSYDPALLPDKNSIGPSPDKFFPHIRYVKSGPETFSAGNTVHVSTTDVPKKEGGPGVILLPAQIWTITNIKDKEDLSIGKMPVQASVCMAASEQEIADTLSNRDKKNSGFNPLLVEIVSTGENCFQGKVIECLPTKSSKKTCDIQGKEYTFSYNFPLIYPDTKVKSQVLPVGKTIEVAVARMPSENNDSGMVLIPLQPKVIKMMRDTTQKTSYKSVVDKVKSFFQ